MKLKTNKWIRMMSMILSLVLLISCVPNPTHAVGSDEFVNDQNVGGENAGINSQVGVTTEKIPMTIQIVAEDESKRGETYKEYVMNNGLRLATVYPSAIHYEENGVWKDIDNTLIAAVSNGKTVYQNAAGAWSVRFPRNLSGSDMISITKDDYTVQFGMAGELRSTGDLVVASIGEIGRGETAGTLAVSNAQVATAQIQQIDLTAARAAAEHPETVLDKLNSRLSYANVYPNTNVVYDLQSNQLKESVILQRYDADLWGYRYLLDTGDLVPVLREDRQIDLYDPRVNEVILTMPAPYMLDNNGETSYDVEVVLTQKGNQYLLSYYLPRAWLVEAERAWPVVLDPVITVQGIYTNVKDITVTENYNEDSGRGVIQCGYYTPAGAMRFYMQFIQLPSIATTNIITNATISLYKPYDSGTTANVEVHKVTQAWESSTISWNNQPAVESNIEDSVVCKLAGRYEWDITNIVNGWYETNNYGMMFKVPSDIETGTTDNWKQFYSADYDLNTETMPLLTITHAPRGSGGGNSIDEAVVLNIDSSVEVTVAASGEKRYFKFTPSTTGFYTFESSNNQGDPFAWLYNSDNNQLHYNDDGGSNYNFQLTYHLYIGKTYYLAAGCYGNGVGNYSVRISKATSPAAIKTTSIAWGDSELTGCDLKQQVVVYKFVPTKTNEYLLYSTGDIYDPRVWLYDSNLNLIDSNDDDAGQRNFRLVATLNAGSTYYIVAGHYSNYTGRYNVNLMASAEIMTNDYQIQNIESLYYMDIHGPYAQEYVHQYTFHTNLQEKWTISKDNDGYYTIRSEFGSNRYVAISSDSYGEDNIVLIDNVSDSAKWKIYYSPTGTYLLEPKTVPGLVLCSPNGILGAELQLAELGIDDLGNYWRLHDPDNSYINIEFFMDYGLIEREKREWETYEEAYYRISDEILDTFERVASKYLEQCNVIIRCDQDFVTLIYSDADLCPNTGHNTPCECVENCQLQWDQNPHENNNLAGFSCDSHCENITRLRNNLIVGIPQNTIRFLNTGHNTCFSNGTTCDTISAGALSDYTHPVICSENPHYFEDTMAHEIAHLFGIYHHAESKNPHCIMETGQRPWFDDELETWFCDECVEKISANRHKLWNC